VVEQKIADVRAKMEGMDADMVFNMDEAALFCQLAPTRSCVDAKTARTTRGTTMQRAAARLTAIVCVNATGTFKFLSIIGNAAQPESFQGLAEDLPLRYFSQKIAWMGAHVYRRWFSDFGDALAAFNNSKKAILLLDNASGHVMDMDTDQLKLCALPPNTTAKYQPIDQGVINATKSIYRREMMGKMLACSDKQAAETEEETVARHAREAAARRGSLGVGVGRSPHVLDAVKLLKVAF